jgi:hypothetical protein
MDNDTVNQKNAKVWAALSAHVSRGEEAVALLEQVFYDCLLGTMGNMTEEQMKVYCRVANFVGHDDGE